MKEKVVLGMSGGVDSSVACYLLKKQGYDVIGVTMQIWEEDESCGSCCGVSAVNDARLVANKLNVPFYVLNFKKVFNEKVVNYFVDEYEKGNTPNPCIACNRYVKWEAFLNKALSLGAKYIATGHYAKIVKLENGRYTLKKSVTEEKDQTYALYNLTQNQLKHTIMCVGDYTKNEIREIAKKIGLNVANKPDSQEICFVPDNDYVKFIRSRTKNKIEKGNFIDKKGNVLGEHKGIINYTIGQRKGFSISFVKPMYVVEINPTNNTITLGDNDDLFKYNLEANDINYMSEEYFDEDEVYDCKIRYSQKVAKCKVKEEDGIIKCTFFEKQRAITRGQSVVFYKNDLVVAGGKII